jgi:transposase
LRLIEYSEPQKSDRDLSYGPDFTKKSQSIISESKTRKVYSPGFRTRVGLEALREWQTTNPIAQAHGVHPVQVSQWKNEIQEQASRLFEGKRGPKPATGQDDPERLYGEIGRLKMELDWLKKIWTDPADVRLAWITGTDGLPLTQQCALAGVCRSTVYARQGTGAGQRGRPAAPASDRRGIYPPSVLWQSADDRVSAQPGPPGQPQTGTTPDATTRSGRDGAGAEYRTSPSAGFCLDLGATSERFRGGMFPLKQAPLFAFRF